MRPLQTSSWLLWDNRAGKIPPLACAMSAARGENEIIANPLAGARNASSGRSTEAEMAVLGYRFGNVEAKLDQLHDALMHEEKGVKPRVRELEDTVQDIDDHLKKKAEQEEQRVVEMRKTVKGLQIALATAVITGAANFAIQGVTSLVGLVQAAQSNAQPAQVQSTPQPVHPPTP